MFTVYVSLVVVYVCDNVLYVQREMGVINWPPFFKYVTFLFLLFSVVCVMFSIVSLSLSLCMLSMMICGTND